MSERDLEARLDAVERALTDGETDLTDLEEAAELAAGVERLEERVESLESTVADLDAAVQAVRGYAGNVRAVNRDVERRASAALAKAETLETAIDGHRGRDPDDDNATCRPGDPSRANRGFGDPPGADDSGESGDRRASSAPGAGPDPERGLDGRGGPGPGPDGASGPEEPTDRRAGPDREPGSVPLKHDRDHGSRDATDGSGARSERGYRVGTLDGQSPDRGRGEAGEDQSAGTSQFIERVRDVL